MMIRRVLCLLVLAASAGPVLGQETPEAAPPVPPPSLPPAPAFRLAPVAGFSDEEAREKAIARRVDEYLASADKAAKADAKFEWELAAANLLLAEGVEAAATMGLLAPTAAPAPPGAEAPLRQAHEILERAARSLQEASSAAGLPDGWGDDASRKLDAVRALADAMQVVLVPSSGEDASRQARRAASRVSVLLEDQDAQLVSGATLWQALLKARSGESKQALAVLDLALADLPKDTRAVSFYQRLLRCRLLAEGGSHAAALALLLQMEERVDGWFGRQGKPDDALRAVALVQLQVLRDWHDRLGEPAQSGQRAWCAARSRAIIADVFDGKADTVVRLGQAVPIVAVPPGTKRERTEGAAEGE